MVSSLQGAIRYLILGSLTLYADLGLCQLQHVPEAFARLSAEPEVIILRNALWVPKARGHLQGIQVVSRKRTQKIFLSGSSRRRAYILQADLVQGRTDQLITLMKDPYRHAGGIQSDDTHLVVGIEDNIARTSSKVCVYDARKTDFDQAKPVLTIDRVGEKERYTAGATGMLPLSDTSHLLVVGNWDSRQWDFYLVDVHHATNTFLSSFDAPDHWGSYQSINLLSDKAHIYAIGLYGEQQKGRADLILVSTLPEFSLLMQHVDSKDFHCDGTEFSAAAGLQVDQKGALHIWSAQRTASRQIVLNKFSQE